MKLFNRKYVKVISIIIPLFIVIFATVSNAQFRKLKNNAFTFGERLDYDVTYSFITAGRGYLQVLPQVVTRANNRKCYDIRFQVSSLESLRWIYQVSDAYRTVMDIEGLFPWEFQQRIREGHYKKDAKAIFDQYGHIAYFKNKTFKVTPYIHDIVSAFYYVRTMNLSAMRPGQIFYLKNFFDSKTNNLGVKVHGKQTVKVPAGTFKCIVIEPLVVAGGLFKSEGQILIWLTDDENKMPVKVSTKILIGSVSADLVKYNGLARPLRSKIG